ncbi:MAG: hypothetical protein IK063_00565, partial [Clostridia bacterium]|nr:hypothetical protein [Clostridia bacterium]
MKKALAVILVLAVPFCFIGCRKIRTKEPSTAVATATLPAFLTEESSAVTTASKTETTTSEEAEKATSTEAKATGTVTASAVSGSEKTETAETGTSAERETVAKNVFDS